MVGGLKVVKEPTAKESIMSIVELDVRVTNSDRSTRRVKAAKSAVRFLRRQAEMDSPDDKEELAEMIWKLYWKMYKAQMLAAPETTRSLLREKYGFWTSAGVNSAFPVAA